MRGFIVDGIKYTKIGDDEFYAQELFESEELWGYLSHNMIKSDRSAFEYVVFDSQNEEVLLTDLKIVRMLNVIQNFLIGLKYRLH